MDEGHSRFDPMRLWKEYGGRFLRYGGVTVVTTIIGLGTLFVALAVFDWPRVPSNFASVLVSTPFAYYLNRSYVWEQDSGNHSAAGEVGPFWILTLIGFVVSTIAIWVAGYISEATWFLLLAQMASFGALWIVKFAILEKYLWPDEEEVPAGRV